MWDGCKKMSFEASETLPQILVLHHLLPVCYFTSLSLDFFNYKMGIIMPTFPPHLEQMISHLVIRSMLFPS